MGIDEGMSDGEGDAVVVGVNVGLCGAEDVTWHLIQQQDQPQSRLLIFGRRAQLPEEWFGDPRIVLAIVFRIGEWWKGELVRGDGLQCWKSDGGAVVVESLFGFGGGAGAEPSAELRGCWSGGGGGEVREPEVEEAGVKAFVEEGRGEGWDGHDGEVVEIKEALCKTIDMTNEERLLQVRMKATVNLREIEILRKSSRV